jgi:hypothetical protein
MTEDDEDEDVRELFQAGAEREKAFYEELNIPELLLVLPQVLINTACYIPVRDGVGNLVDVQFARRWATVILHKNDMQALGLAVTGFWPASLGDFRSAVEKQLGPEQWNQVAMVDANNGLTLQQHESFLKRLARCRPAQTNSVSEGPNR